MLDRVHSSIGRLDHLIQDGEGGLGGAHQLESSCGVKAYLKRCEFDKSGDRLDIRIPTFLDLLSTSTQPSQSEIYPPSAKQVPVVEVDLPLASLLRTEPNAGMITPLTFSCRASTVYVAFLTDSWTW